MRTFGRVTAALNCQLLMIGTRRALTIEEISQCVDQPTTDPRSETVKAQWLQSPGTDQLVHLCAQLSALVGSPQVVIDHDPAAIGKSVAKGVDIATDIGVRIKNEQPNFPCAGDLPHHCNRVRIERTAIYQSNLIEETEAFQILHQIFETIFRADPRVVDAAAPLDANDFLFRG